MNKKCTKKSYLKCSFSQNIRRDPLSPSSHPTYLPNCHQFSTQLLLFFLALFFFLLSQKKGFPFPSTSPRLFLVNLSNPSHLSIVLPIFSSQKSLTHHLSHPLSASPIHSLPIFFSPALTSATSFTILGSTNMSSSQPPPWQGGGLLGYAFHATWLFWKLAPTPKTSCQLFSSVRKIPPFQEGSTKW